MEGENLYYDNQSLSDFGLIMVAPETAPSFVGRTIEKSSITSIRDIPNTYSVQYSDVLTLNFAFIKNPCSNSYDAVMSDEEINDVRTWLESPKVPTELFVDDKDNMLDVFYFGFFTDIQPFLVNQTCYGLYATFTCNAPYGFSGENLMTYSFGDSKNITGKYVNASANKYDYVKPVIKIYADTVFNNQTLEIKNITDNNNTMRITLPNGLSVLNIDCNKNSVTDENGNLLTLDDIGIKIDDNFNYNFLSSSAYRLYWLRLLYGTNSINFTASQAGIIDRIEITSRHPVKTGGI